MNIARISVNELGAIVKQRTKKPGIDYLVIDVRDNDFIGGNIPGAINVPAYEMNDRSDKLVEELARIPMLVFHCALSQVRGPKSARIYSQAAERALSLPATNAQVLEGLRQQSVYILTGGFTTWYYQYKDEEDMIENVVHSLWG